MDFEGWVVPARRKLTISGNLPSNNVKTYVESTGARRRGKSSITEFSAEERGRRSRECVNMQRRGHDDFAAAKRGELRHFDAEQAFLKANIDEEIYIKIPEEYQEFPRAVGLLNKAIYGLIQTERFWNNKFCNDMTAIGFE